jgi:anti-sigma regulatory factor (Ser/Thr protein kinase)
VPADLAALGGVRSSLAQALVREGWGGESAGRVLTASTEAMANAMQHGSGPAGALEVAFTVTAGAASVRVLDHGRPGRRPRLPDSGVPPASSTHGRGRLLMRALADEIEVRRAGRGTEVLLGFTPG